jgi:toxin-antitoxin system PIN domain toxin
LTAVDTNILVYAHREELPQHARAKRLVTELAEGDAPWGIPVFCLTEFVRVATHPKLFDPPYEADEACTALERILESPSLQVLMPGPRFSTLFFEAVSEAKATGNLIFDAQIVAVCREAGVSRLVTEDRDFARFRRFSIEGV